MRLATDTTGPEDLHSYSFTNTLFQKKGWFQNLKLQRVLACLSSLTSKFTKYQGTSSSRGLIMSDRCGWFRKAVTQKPEIFWMMKRLRTKCRRRMRPNLRSSRR
ncbi:Hypothetical predicted protein [Lynx pardinus]|uniref:Uncharacterized protein n=1 Tax=Lynx pardinus TaxID=191816 RepID=A0A485MB93_LYNPA|nr:Hypothetical predicted protein [Lynx pardinus]